MRKSKISDRGLKLAFGYFFLVFCFGFLIIFFLLEEKKFVIHEFKTRQERFILFQERLQC